jgi:hypothetical protein
MQLSEAVKRAEEFFVKNPEGTIELFLFQNIGENAALLKKAYRAAKPKEKSPTKADLQKELAIAFTDRNQFEAELEATIADIQDFVNELLGGIPWLSVIGKYDRLVSYCPDVATVLTEIEGSRMDLHNFVNEGDHTVAIDLSQVPKDAELAPKAVSKTVKGKSIE